MCILSLLLLVLECLNLKYLDNLLGLIVMLITQTVSFDITFGVCQHHHNVGSRHLPVVHGRVTSKLKPDTASIIHKSVGFKLSTKEGFVIHALKNMYNMYIL